MNGQRHFSATQPIIAEINELLHHRLDKNWLANEWKIMDSGTDFSGVHPFVRMAHTAHQQINNFVRAQSPGITPEIFELSELAVKINDMSRRSIPGLKGRIGKLLSSDYKDYDSARYEIQVGGMLVQRGHIIEFIEEKEEKTPDILVKDANDLCEIECKHKESIYDQSKYIRSIYNTTQTAREQFSKKYPGLVLIEIDSRSYDDFINDSNQIKEDINGVLRNSKSISGILLTSKIFLEDEHDFIYRHRVMGFMNSNPRHRLPVSIAKNLVNA
jgi:hypothetical protein